MRGSKGGHPTPMGKLLIPCRVDGQNREERIPASTQPPIPKQQVDRGGECGHFCPSPAQEFRAEDGALPFQRDYKEHAACSGICFSDVFHVVPFNKNASVPMLPFHAPFLLSGTVCEVGRFCHGQAWHLLAHQAVHQHPAPSSLEPDGRPRERTWQPLPCSPRRVVQCCRGADRP